MKPLDAFSSSTWFVCYFHFPCTSSLYFCSSSLLPVLLPSPPRTFLATFFYFPHIPTFHILLFSLLFLSREVLSLCQALNKPLSFIHDVLITNSVINTLPNQSFSSIMADQSGLMLHKKLLDRLLGVNTVHKAREFDIGLDRIEHSRIVTRGRLCLCRTVQVCNSVGQ